MIVIQVLNSVRSGKRKQSYFRAIGSFERETEVTSGFVQAAERYVTQMG
jgi:hypothetical protein